MMKLLVILFIMKLIAQINIFKWKDSLETWVILLIFSLELEISGLTVQKIHENS